MNVRVVIAVAALVVAGALGLGGCGGSSGSPDGQRVLRGSYPIFPDYLDPALAYSTEASTALANSYIPLLTYAHANGAAGTRVVPGLAKALPTITDGGRTYTLFLRPGLKYSDGTPVRASDFAHTVERTLAIDSAGSPFYMDIVGAEHFAETKRGSIGGIETDDASGKITIELIQPRGTFVNELALTFVALLPADTPVEDLTAHPPPATGPYVITKSDPGRGWEYERNPQWAKANSKAMPDFPSGHVSEIKISVDPNPTAQVNGVENGEFDWMKNPPPPDRYADIKEKYEGTQLRVESTISTFYFWMNTTKPPFDDVTVRRAVNYAVDPAALERIYAGSMIATQQILPRGMPGYRKFELYPHDLAKAKAMIARADPTDRDITVWSNSAAPNNEAGEYYEDLLSKLGFHTTLKLINPTTYLSVIGNLTTPDLDTGWSNWFQDYPHPNDFFEPQLSGESIQPTSNTNWAQIDDPALNAKISKLSREQLGPEQEAQYAALDKSFMRLAPWAPFGTLTLGTFVSSAIDLDKLIVSPIFGQDLTSFQFK